MPKAESIWTSTFLLLCVLQFLGYAQHFMLLPTLPLYVQHNGGTPFVVGIILAGFGITGVFIRPVMGYLSDRFGEAKVMVIGMTIKGTSSVLFMIPSVDVIGLVNALRGIGWAGLNVGGYSLLSLITPQPRRGEASGYYRGIQTSVAIFFPAAALWMLKSFQDFKAVFIFSAVLAVFGSVLGVYMGRGLVRQPESLESQKSASFSFVDRVVILPISLHVLMHLSLNSVSAFAVLYAVEIDVGNVEWLFVTNGTITIIAQPLLGALSDKFGRGRMIALAFTLQIAAFGLIVNMTNLYGLIGGGALYTLGIAVGASSLLALALDRADPARRGQTMAGFSIAYPLSSGLGGVVIGSAINWMGYVPMYLLMGGLSSIGLITTLAKRTSLK